MKRIGFGIIALVLGLGATVACAAPATKAELAGRVAEATAVLNEFFSIPEKSIPPDLLKKSKAICIFPSTVKAGLFVAGQFGRGVILVRKANGDWSEPSLSRISGGSVGLQIGGQASDIVLVVTNDRGVQGLLKNKFTIGGDASAAAGPVGRDAEAKTDWQLKSSIYSYSRSKGLFAGVSVDGMVINEDKEANAIYYGKPLTAEEILLENKAAPTDETRELVKTLGKHS